MSDRIVNLEERFSRQPETGGGAKPNGAAQAAVISLNDLRSGSEVEIQRLETRVTVLSEELGVVRNLNQQLAAANLRLDAELKGAKLQLSKVQIKELRSFEKSLSWRLR